MPCKNYCAVTGVLLSLVALAHLLRIVSGAPVEIDGAAVPMLFSWIGFLVPAALVAWAIAIVRRADVRPTD